MQILRTLGIIGANQVITADAMKAYDGVFATEISVDVLAAIAKLSCPRLSPRSHARPCTLAASRRSSPPLYPAVELVLYVSQP